MIRIAPAWFCLFSTGQPFPPLFTRSSLSEAGHRYASIISSALGSWQFFSDSFTAESCHKLFLLPTVFRGSFYIMIMLRQTKRTCSASGYGVTNDNWFTVGCNLNVWPCLMSSRAYTISRKNRTVGIVLLSAFIFTTAVSTMPMPMQLTLALRTYAGAMVCTNL